eukprot:354528-Chlamydomonas_euryale.AAC.1
MSQPLQRARLRAHMLTCQVIDYYQGKDEKLKLMTSLLESKVWGPHTPACLHSHSDTSRPLLSSFLSPTLQVTFPPSHPLTSLSLLLPLAHPSSHLSSFSPTHQLISPPPSHPPISFTSLPPPSTPHHPFILAPRLSKTRAAILKRRWRRQRRRHGCAPRLASRQAPQWARRVQRPAAGPAAVAVRSGRLAAAAATPRDGVCGATGGLGKQDGAVRRQRFLVGRGERRGKGGKREGERGKREATQEEKGVKRRGRWRNGSVNNWEREGKAKEEYGTERQGKRGTGS